MPQPRYRYCTQMAENVLKRHGIDSEPIDVETIATSEGFTIVRRTDWPKTLHGLLHEKSIGLNAQDAIVKQRFSLAHELGHAFLGHHTMRDEAPTLDNPPSEQAALYQRHLEQEAEAFAAALLIPERLLRVAVREYRTPEALARAFNVSAPAMFLALERTKLIKALI